MNRAIRAAALFLLVLALSWPALADETESEKRREQRERLQEISCRDDLDRPESWLDRSHSYVSQRLCEPAAWFDGFFGDDRALEETPVGTFFRLRTSGRWDQTEGTGAGVQMRANVILPGVSERVRLLVRQDEDISGDLGDVPAGAMSDRTRLGLRFLASERVRSRFDIDATVRVASSGLNPRVRGRYRYVRGLTETTLVRTTQSVFWEREDGFGTTTRLDWEWLPDRDRLLRWTGEGTFSEGSEGVDWRTSMVAFRQLDMRTALRAELGTFGYTRPRFEVEEYFAALRFRRQFHRHWLFYELQPEHAWPLDPFTGQRRRDWRFTFTLEIQFENERGRRERLRRYAGDEADPDDWGLEPIPVEAPGERRAEDPVLMKDPLFEDPFESVEDDPDDEDDIDDEGDGGGQG